MNQKQQPVKKGRQRAALGLVVCFAAAVALTATYTWKNYRDRMEREQAQAEEEISEQRQKTLDLAEQASAAAQKAKETQEEQKDRQDEALPEISSQEQPQPEDTKETPEKNSGSAQTAGTVSHASFTENDQLLWPVDGNVIMSFSMDKTMYFSTLDQYKYNPALVLSGAVGDNVIASAPGVVKSIDVLAQTGTTVTVDMGNGYEILYGQLKEVPVMTGDYVEAGTVIGYLSEPTKYYSVEGCNLYFEMRKDGQPVNPMDYLADSADE